MLSILPAVKAAGRRLLLQHNCDSKQEKIQLLLLHEQTSTHSYYSLHCTGRVKLVGGCITSSCSTLGLYSALRACRAISFRSSLQPKSTVATTFCSCGTMPLGCLARSTASSCTTTAVLGDAATAAMAVQNSRA
eukprot:GHRQ01014557.1.p1 GENE.GHRQ01014557.1~~GHRQ01014557.1.p1  ORF type:complete len:134 (+),score=24.83 GHRQ01014557.1:62-463(+)